MHFRTSRALVAARMISFLGLPLAFIWVALLTLNRDTASIAAGLIISLPALLYVVVALRFRVTLASDRLLVRALGTHVVPLASIRAVSVKQRGLRLVVVVDTAEHGWITLPAPIALTVWGRARFERQHEAIQDWWEAGRDRSAPDPSAT